MSEMIALEVRFFLGSFLSGIFLLFVYEMLRLWRWLVPHGKLWVNVEDFFFWVAASGFLFQMIYRLNSGVIRGFSIVCLIMGMIVGQKIAKIGKKGLKKTGKPVRMGIEGLRRFFWRKHEKR
ncbi:MAG: spore cortex biosynthesis protein YabQ [Acetatifactor sp.]|nr:spore cortex biosynthesis protein YabQ [Acetatifactor sp.]